MGRIRESQRWLKCTHTRAAVWFLCKTSLHFYFVLLGSKSSSISNNFYGRLRNSRRHTTHPRVSCRHASCQPCHPHTTYAAFVLKKKYLRFVYLRKQVYTLLCYPRNPRGISAGASVSYLGKRCIPCYITHATHAACQSNFPTQFLVQFANEW